MTDFSHLDVNDSISGNSEEFDFNLDALNSALDEATDFPVPKLDLGLDNADDQDLPSPKAAVGLPSPKSVNGFPSPETSAGLPSPKNGVGLPSPKINAGLPSPKVNAGLPSPKVNAGLPSPKVNAGLPSPKVNAGLPSPNVNAGLPSPKINAGLPSPKINAGLPSPKSSAGFSMPNSTEDNSLDLGDTRLPGVKMDAGLPSPKSPVGFSMPNSTEDNSLDLGDTRLPGVKMDAGLPSPKSPVGFSMPNSADAGLPSPKLEAGLPSPKMNAGLPSPKSDAGIPRPKFESAEVGSQNNVDSFGLGLTEELPSLKQIAELPSPKSNARSLVRDDFPEPQNSARSRDEQPLSDEIPQGAVRTNTKMFSGALDSSIRSSVTNPVDQQKNNLEVTGHSSGPVGKTFEDSALGVVKTGPSIQPPILKLDRQEPTGAFKQSRDFDNDSGLPVADDPLGLNLNFTDNAIPDTLQADLQTHKLPVPNLDMTGTKADMLTHEMEQPSLEPTGTDIEMPKFDVLGLLGEEGDSEDSIRTLTNSVQKLKDNVASGQSAQAAGLVNPLLREPANPESNALLGERGSSGQADLSGAPTGNAPVPPPIPQNLPGGSIVEADDGQNGELVFDLNSIQSDKQSITREDKNKKASAAKKTFNSKVILIVALTIIVLGAVGGAIYKIMLDMQTVHEEDLANIPEESKAEVHWDIVKLDSKEAYLSFFTQAIKRLKQKDIDSKERQEIQGKILISTALSMVRFPDALQDQVESLDDSVLEIVKTCESSWCALGLWSWGKFKGQQELVKSVEDKLSSDKQDIQNVVLNAMLYREWKNKDQSKSDARKSADALLRNLKDSDWPLAAWIKSDLLQTIGKFDEADKALSASITANTGEENAIPPSALMLKKVRNDLALDRIEQADKTLASLMAATNIPAGDKKEAEQLALGTKASLGEWNVEQKNLTDFLQNHLNSESDVQSVAQVCRWLNKTSDCRIAFQILLENNQKNLTLRSELIRMSLEEMDAAAIFNPAMPLSKAPLVQIDMLIEEGIKLSPESEDLWGAKAVSAFAARDYETMENAVDEVERGEKKIWVGAFLRQLKSFANGDEAQQNAARDALKGYMKDVSDPEMAVSLSYALKAVNESESALQLLEEMAKYHPDNTTVMNAYLRHTIDFGDQKKAESILKRLEKRGALTSEHEYTYARLVEQLGDINGALERMIVLSEKNDGNMPEYLAYIGELFMKQSKCESALPKFNQALEINPSDPETHFNKGYCLYQDKQFDPALVEFNEAAAQDDSNRKYDLWIGRAMKDLKMNADAQRSFTTVIDEFVQKPEENRTEQDIRLAAEAYFYRAETHKLQNRRTESRLDFLEALKMEPENLQFLSGYAIFLYENEKLKDCIATVDKIESIAGSSMAANLYFIRGLSKLNSHKRSEAVTDLELAYKRGFAELADPGIIGVRESAEIYERLGYLYRDLGRKAEAREMLRKFIEKSEALSDNARKDIQGDIDKI